MENSWISYPIGAITAAAQYMLGRVVIFVLVLCIGSAVGCFTGSWSFVEGVVGFVAMPLMLLVSLFKSYGLIVVPVIGLCFLFYAKGDWGGKLLLVSMFLMWLVAHDMKSWEYDEDRPESLGERREREFRESMEPVLEAVKEVSESQE